MTENPLTVDLLRLGAVATRVDGAADAIGRFPFAGLHDEDLPGSAVAGLATPALVAARLDGVVADLRIWAAAARMSAAAFENAEQNGVARLGPS
jgi:hypothetical protein